MIQTSNISPGLTTNTEHSKRAPAKNNSSASQTITVSFDTIGSKLQLYIEHEGEGTTKTYNPAELTVPCLSTVLLSELRPLLLEYLPTQALDIRLDNRLADERFQGIHVYLVQLANVIHATNKLLQDKLVSEFNTQDHTRTLFYNAKDHYFLKEIFQATRESHEVSYEEFTTGWDPVNRNWNATPTGLPPVELIAYIKQHKISRIVGINMYYLEYCLKHHNIYLLSVLKHIGVSYHILDWDLYEVNPLLGLNKSAFHCNSFTRFDLFPSLQKEWNRIKGLNNITYYPAQAIREESDGEINLNPDFKILCAANSRINSFIDPIRLERTLYAMSHCSEDNLFFDFQFWFHCISLFLARKVQAPLLEKIKLRSKLIKIHFDGVSLLKYEALHGLNTSQAVELYGDAGWDQLFPEYYQGSFLEKKTLENKLKSQDYLYLQVNNNFSYLEANSVISEAVAWGVPFIGFPAVVKTADYTGFSEIEYRNTAEMNHKIQNMLEILNSPNLKASVTALSKNLSTSWVENCINLASGTSPLTNTYEHSSDEHLGLFEPTAEAYIEKNEQPLFDYLLYLQGNINFGPHKLSAAGKSLQERPYIQNLRSLQNS